MTTLGNTFTLVLEGAYFALVSYVYTVTYKRKSLARLLLYMGNGSSLIAHTRRRQAP